MIKRLFDIVVSAAGLLVLLPVLLAIIIWIKFDSAGPVLFRQVRVGLRGREFRIHKFRTMVADAPRKGPQLTVGHDARITRAGAFLRRYKLDELPQLWDVFIGNMSLVGPRPEVPRYVAAYPAAVRSEVLSVRPGITDDAAIEFSEESDLLARAADPEQAYLDDILPRKLQLYSRYVRSRTFSGDLKILLRTLQIIAFGRRNR